MDAIGESYDVVIVGGRPAGAGLAGWLALRAPKLRVLVVDRASFPSPPAVPSCPTVHPGSLRLLDELGVDEAALSEGGARLSSMRVHFRDSLRVLMTLPTVHGRDYLYSVDRARFDEALWRNLARHPNVTARDRVVVDEVVRGADGRVTGVTMTPEGGEKVTVRARWVVAADGRFSALARKLGAAVTEDGGPETSSLYFADWTGVAPMEDETRAEVQVHTTGRGLNVLFFPLDGKKTVCVHMRSDRAEVEGDAQGFYRRTMATMPALERRLAGATQVSKVLGLKRVGNGFRAAAGEGWFLAGDALHYKDPVDGQGIYDALLETKLLAALIAQVADGRVEERGIGGRYAAAVRAATRPMYLETLKRLKNELYEEAPPIVERTLLRWMLNDRGYQDRFMRFLCRDGSPENWLPPSAVAGAVARGVRRDLASLGR